MQINGSPFPTPHDLEIIAALTCCYFSTSVSLPIFRVEIWSLRHAGGGASASAIDFFPLLYLKFYVGAAPAPLNVAPPLPTWHMST